ncbi:MAG: glycosyltransferase, partial [Pseudomonadota bacterium]
MSVAPNVSVIMPAYGAADTIEASVISVQGQTLDDWELIIVDDGSPDDTADVAKQLAANDSRVRLVRQSNAG